MAGYLQRKYVGRYRVKAEYDQSTNDFPRLEDGRIDPSFDDFYIECAHKVQIKHGVGNVLGCFVPSKQRGTNILKKIYDDKVGEDLPEDKTSFDKKYFQSLCDSLVKKGVLVSAEVLDFEVIFEFKTDMMEYIADLVGAKTSGANISPFSSKNLPKKAYEIPDEDLDLYKAAIKDFPKREVNMNGATRVMNDALFMRRVNAEFDKKIIAAQPNPKKFDIDKDRKFKCLKGKEYIHSIGLWNEYCEFLKEHGGDQSGR